MLMSPVGQGIFAFNNRTKVRTHSRRFPLQMFRSVFSLGGRRVLAATFALSAVTAVIVAPAWFASPTASATGSGLFERTESHDSELPNYDIRNDKAAFEKVARLRESAGKHAAEVADMRESFVEAEESLRTRVSTLKIEYNTDIRIPEVIGTDVSQGRNFLTGPTNGKRSETLKSFLKQNSSLVGVDETEIDGLKVFADYKNPEGPLSFVELNQEFNGIPVFRGEVKAGFAKNGEIIRVINNLAPGIDESRLSTDFRNPADAVRTAAGNIGHELRESELSVNAAESNDLKVVFGEGDWATTAEKMYFPTEPGVAVPAWRVLIWQPVSAYYVIVDAETQTVLWRKNITEDQTQSATLEVYGNANSMTVSAESPAPLTPGPISPILGTQGALLTRANDARIGNETVYSFNNNGWITDGTNSTDGNATEAGLDRVSPNGVDAPMPGDGTCPGTGCRTFTSTWNPPPGNPAPGDSPLEPQAQRGAVIQMFYAMNLYHDELYRLGFTEQARNFQHDNFGRGGLGNDRVSSEGQDSSGTNNANFSTPADGGRGRMQMYIFTGPNPDRDGTTDIDIVFHEATHGTSNRLHGNGSGLSLNMSRGMGEGWSDFYAHALLSEPSDPINGIYTTGGYVLVTPSYFGNFYYGIRRFPKAVMAFTGGPNNRPHNPLTFADVDSTQANVSDGAFSPSGGGAADQVHNAGEVWSSALWEVRAKYVQRLGWAVGNRRVLQHVTDGMKLAPLGPTFLTERDAIIAAALAGGDAADVADMWAGFAIRGMGFSASIQTPGTGSGTARVTEAFDLPNLLQTPVFTVSDATGNNNGVPEPGEQVVITLPLTNNTGNPATNVAVQLVGGGNANYGTINNGQTVSRTINYTVPAASACGSVVGLTFNATSSLGPASFVRSMSLGQPIVTFSENFDGVTAPAFPAGWTAVAVQNGTNFVTSTVGPDSGTNSAFALDPTTVGGGTDLTSPSIPITSAAATVSFRNKYATEPGWDGGVLEISIGAGPFQDIIAAGGSFVQNGYNGVLGANGANNPLAGRNSWNGNSGGYLTTIARLPAAAAGQNVRLKWRFGADDNTAVTGWNVDTIQVSGNYSCIIVDPGTARADFDGDGRTDISVFRPSEGNWYINGSTSGFGALNWGIASDALVPGDYDGDGKADFAVFRASADPINPDFYMLNSNGFVYTGVSWGIPGDVPANADYDGDGKYDIGIFRASEQKFYILRSSDGGNSIIDNAGTRPVPGDYDGDGKADAITVTGNAWAGPLSGGGTLSMSFGTADSFAVPGDYDGDGTTDLAMFGPTGLWQIRRSSDQQTQNVQFGVAGDIPVPGNYRGTGSEDIAIYRAGQWWIYNPSGVFDVYSFGLASDVPIPSKATP